MIQSRLNEIYANAKWSLLYPDKAVSHLPQCDFDHYTLLRNVTHINNYTLPKPFYTKVYVANLSFILSYGEIMLEKQ